MAKEDRRGEEGCGLPASVLGVASVISNIHTSQHTSSSALPPPNQPRPPRRLFFSKNCTAICPRTLEFGEVVDESWRIRAVVRMSIRVSSSTSVTVGRVRSRTSMEEGRMEGK